MVPGLHNLQSDQYHADPCPKPSLSNSIANILITQSPLHAWYAHSRLNPNYEPDQSSRFDLGSVAHQLLLERRADGIVIVEASDWRTKAAKELRDQARAEGKFPILAHHYAAADSMVGAALRFLDTTELAGMFQLGLPEQTIIWNEGSSWCRCRPDLLSSDYRVCLDYKTTENAEPEAFIRQIGRMSYDLQAEWYTRGIKAATDIEPVFVFMAQETTAPFACSLVSLSNAYRALGQSKIERALGLWGRCIETDTWPAYSTRIAYAEPRPWDLVELDENKDQESDE